MRRSQRSRPRLPVCESSPYSSVSVPQHVASRDPNANANLGVSRPSTPPHLWSSSQLVLELRQHKIKVPPEFNKLQLYHLYMTLSQTFPIKTAASPHPSAVKFVPATASPQPAPHQPVLAAASPIPAQSVSSFDLQVLTQTLSGLQKSVQSLQEQVACLASASTSSLSIPLTHPAFSAPLSLHSILPSQPSSVLPSQSPSSDPPLPSSSPLVSALSPAQESCVSTSSHAFLVTAATSPQVFNLCTAPPASSNVLPGVDIMSSATVKQNVEDLSLLRFIRAELTRGYLLEHNEAKYTERRERVYTCLRIPRELEKLMVFGFFLCLDAFLYVFTLLPLRVLLALIRFITLPCYSLSDRRLLQPAQVCDILKGVIMVICYFMMHYVDYSMMYHLIRGQSVIKLYIIYNMLEVADRLFSSFGQDILDALYWTATEPKERKRAHIGVIPHFFMAVLYVFLHAILIMVQATTLNVAFNSHNKSLLTIMMSNNFVEIKGSVFKKFEKNNLFQMSNSDIKERFTNYVLLLIVCLRNMEQFSWNPDHLWVLFPDVCMVIASEIAVDIVKHAFITKFNDITADVYSEYRASLAFDLVSSRQKNAYTDYSDSVSRRMGFIPLPLAVLLIRVVTSSIKVQGALAYACVVLFYFGLQATPQVVS
ncbi:transmembrane anterior posterior transformation protein 1 homolog isoform X3 [Latimeria chalumnae]|uniref:transmembrane anterior posterior transformation protein 1 homolog isoform X3 n=1 Tax=Latimeria chalumnae TaxID=7897 RepID=UPI0003C17D23|nr:PREDICTED: transmembrane anterior posterior transformation protein 1 homolog isoform X3 [Latimeria chalumnae]|eukprot:XP_005990478.1 PREDICTED: transmembrane anterior posterior transformation protein 1 homolog isoform X3 [Latimeria chalumnae]